MKFFIHVWDRIKDAYSVKKLCILWSLTIACILYACYGTYVRGLAVGYHEGDSVFHGCFSLLSSYTIFITVKSIFANKKLSQNAEKAMISLGSCTFGIYLLHPYVKDMWFFNIWYYFIKNLGINPMLCIVFMCFVVLIISYYFPLPFRKYPL